MNARKVQTKSWYSGRKNILIITIIALLLCLLLTACAPGARDSTRKAGFFWGIWHGWIAPISLIWQLFNPAVRIYDVNNTGWWYDLGFYIALLGGFGGISFIRKSK